MTVSGGTRGADDEGWDFFVSYTSADEQWAKWVAWQLEDAKYRVLIQAWDFVAGSNWTARMDEGIQMARRTIAILSKAYLGSVYGKAEWRAAWRTDPDGFTSKLVPIRVEDCERPGLLGGIVSIDLFGLTQDGAHRRLLDQIHGAIDGRAKPTVPPSFPVLPRQAPPVRPPDFPATANQARTRDTIETAPTVSDFRASRWPRRSGFAIPQPLSQPVTGHTGAVWSVAFTANGRTLATGSGDGTARLWDLADPNRPRQIGEPLTGHTDDVYSVALTAYGDTLATGSYDRTARLWDLTDTDRPRQVRRHLTGHTGAVYSVAFTVDGRTLATGSGDRTARLWNLTDLNRPRQIGRSLTGHTDGVTSVAFTADGFTLATGGIDKTVRLWDLTIPTEPRGWGQPLTGHTGDVRSVAFTADGRILATGSGDGTARLWNVTFPTRPQQIGEPPTGHTRQIGQSLIGHTDGVTSVAFTADGRILAAGGIDKTVRLWKL